MKLVNFVIKGILAIALLSSQCIFADTYQNYIVGKLNVTNFPANVVPGNNTYVYFGNWCDASGNSAGGPPSQISPNSPNNPGNEFGVCGNPDSKLYLGTVEYRFYPTDDNNTYVGCSYGLMCTVTFIGTDGKSQFCLGVTAKASAPESSGNPGYTASCSISELTQPASSNNFIGSAQFNFGITPNSSNKLNK